MITKRWLYTWLGIGLSSTLMAAEIPKPTKLVEEPSPIVNVTMDPLPGGQSVSRPATVVGGGRSSSMPIMVDTTPRSMPTDAAVRSNWRPSVADGQTMSTTSNVRMPNYYSPVSSGELAAPSTVMVAPTPATLGCNDGSCASNSGSCFPASRSRLFSSRWNLFSACRPRCNWVACQPSLPVDPIGTKVNTAFQIQADEAKAERLVFYREEFELDREELKRISLAHVDRIAEWFKTGTLPYIMFPVRVEPTGDPKLDEMRRMTVAKLLMDRQAITGDQQVVIGFGKAEGLRGEEIDRMGRSAPANGSGGSSGMNRGGGGLGGGGGGLGGSGGLFGLGIGNAGAIFGQ